MVFIHLLFLFIIVIGNLCDLMDPLSLDSFEYRLQWCFVCLGHFRAHINVFIILIGEHLMCLFHSNTNKIQCPIFNELNCTKIQIYFINLNWHLPIYLSDTIPYSK